MISLVYGLSKASTHGWGAAATSVPLVVGAVLLVIFVLIEAKARAPLMPLGIFSDRNRWGSYLLMFCIAAGLFAMFFFLTQFLQNVLGWSPLRTGVGFLPMSAGIVAAAGLASRLVGQVGVRLPLLIGPSLAIVGFLLLSRLSVTSSYADVIGPLLLIAVGMGLSFVPLTLSAVSGVAHDEAGLASALLNTSQQIGGALGLAVLATVAIDATRSSLANAAALAHGHIGAVAQGIATTHGYTTAFEVAAGVDFLGLLVALFVLKKPAEGATETAANEDEAGVEREPRAYSLRVGANDPVPES
jgi:predicted MFS family arabinose efflux permease